MKYDKRPLTFEEQADQLIERGLVVESKPDLVSCLERISYYRLSAYWYAFRLDDDRLEPGTSLEVVLRRYDFDRRLRLIVLDAIERVEIAVRTTLTYEFSHQYGSFGYLDAVNFARAGRRWDHREYLRRLRKETSWSTEPFVRHFRDKYAAEQDLPLWMASELMSFGTLFTMFANLRKHDQNRIADRFEIHGVVLQSWLHCLNYVRNMCAHHARLWDRELAIKPLIPRANKHPEWHVPIRILNNRIFAVLTILQFLTHRMSGEDQWTCQLMDHLGSDPDIPHRTMGFVDGWRDCPIWRLSAET